MTSSVKLYPRNPGSASGATNALPQLIQTPSGLALLELQGTLNLPQEAAEAEDGQTSVETPLGRIAFPDFRADALDPSNTSWMRRVHLYVGRYQRLNGEVKKLPRPVAVVRRRRPAGSEDAASSGEDGAAPEELEVVEIVKYKLIFSQRPEPVTTAST